MFQFLKIFSFNLLAQNDSLWRILANEHVINMHENVLKSTPKYNMGATIDRRLKQNLNENFPGILLQQKDIR